MSVQQSYLNIFDRCFQTNNFSELQSPEEDLLTGQGVDFSIQESSPFARIVKKVASFSAKTLFLPWGLYEAAKFSVQRSTMTLAYPAQSRLVRYLLKDCIPIRPEHLDLCRLATARELILEGFLVRHVTLEKNGVRFSGLMIGHPDTIANGKWAVQATGNLEPVEHAAVEFARTYHRFGINTLMINGPSVGRSEGRADFDSMGDAQQVGIAFAESALRAKELILAGRSLGGAAMGSAILKHTFKPDVRYLVIRQMSFDRLSHISAALCGRISPIIGSLVGKLVKWSCEMDNLKASKKLSDLGIQEMIVQATRRDIPLCEIPDKDDFMTDGPIFAEASLGAGLVEAGILKYKTFVCLRNADHMTHLAISKPLDLLFS